MIIYYDHDLTILIMILHLKHKSYKILYNYVL